MAVVGVLFGEQIIFNLGGGSCVFQEACIPRFLHDDLVLSSWEKALNTLLPTPERPGYGCLMSVLVSCRR